MSRILAAFAALLFLVADASAQTTTHTVTLVWTNPTTRTDGTALSASEIATVEVFDSVGGASTSFGFGTSPFITPRLPVGTHTFSLVLTDKGGNKSAVSNTLQVIVQAPPSPPTLNSATLN